MYLYILRAMKKILTVGEAMIMFIADEKKNLVEADKFTKYLAGAEVNVSIGLSRLGYNVTYMSAVGDDPFGEYIRQFLKKENIDTDYIVTNKKRSTGFQLKEKNDKDDPKVVYFRKNSAASRLSKTILQKIKFEEYEILHVTGIFPALSKNNYNFVKELIKSARKKGLLITFDPNCRPVLWESEDKMKTVINEIAAMCDVIIPGYNEGKILTGETDRKKIAEFYIKKGVKEVFLKYGTEKSIYFNKKEMKEVPCFKVKVVDTVGAGDGFAVGVISGLMEKLPKEKILERGNAIGAIQVTNLSDNDGLPTKTELEKFIKKHKKV